MSMEKHIIEFLDAVSGKRGDLDCWLECNTEEEVCAAVNGALHEKDEIILAQQARIEQLKTALNTANSLLLHALSALRPSGITFVGDGPDYDLVREVIATPDDLSALRAHDAELLAPYQWQPIETAPKDGTEVILWFPFKDVAINGLYGEVSEGDWETGYRKWMEWLVADDLWFQEDPSQAPTHWMPLPSTDAIEKGGV